MGKKKLVTTKKLFKLFFVCARLLHQVTPFPSTHRHLHKILQVFKIHCVGVIVSKRPVG